MLLGLTLSSFASPSEISPTTEHLLQRENYSLSYDGLHRQPRWVYEYLTKENLQGSSQRTNHHFQEDRNLPKQIRSQLKDYANSGFDRGHLMPAADAHSSEQAMKDTFYLSNVSPQPPEFNRGIWAKLEKHIRTLTAKYRALHVFTGPLYLPEVEADGKKYVKYEVIGKNNVAVPTHYFKLVLVESKKQYIPLEAYILPNKPINNMTGFQEFQTTMEKVEILSGIIFKKD